MKNLFFFLFLLSSGSVLAQEKWNADPLGQKTFIENKGQFSISTVPVIFGAWSEGVQLYFTKAGLIYHHVEQPIIEKDEREALEKGETEFISAQPINHLLAISWEGANKNARIVAEQVVPFYYTYPDPVDPSGRSTLKANAFKKIVYKDLYPNIDLEYVFPEDKEGIKYNLVLHPGADPSLIKMKYDGAKNISLDGSGNVVVESSFGEFVDHAPETFYAKSQKRISSAFNLNGNVVSFSFPSFPPLGEQEGALIIDPWATNPVFPGYNSAYDVEYDFAGNVYVYGGASPYIEVKLNNAGVIQWIYTAALFTHIGYYGDLAVDPVSGSSYIVEGTYWPFTPGGSRVAKVNGAGMQVAMYPTGNSTMKEAWRAVYDNCNKNVIIAGSSFNNSQRYQAYILDTNCTTVNSVNVLAGTSFLLNEQDMVMLAVDEASNCFMANCGDKLIKVPAASLTPTAFALPNNHSFSELMSIAYIRNITPSSCGMNGMAVSTKYVYTYDGGLLQRWNKSTGAFMNGTTLSATKYRWGGIAVSECDEIFIGSTTGVVQLDTNFSVIANFPSPAGSDTVYDVRLAPGNIMYACGKSFVASYQLNMAGCNSFSITATSSGSCTGQGSATVTVTGGSSSYSYSWSPSGQTTMIATGLFAGDHTVTVTDNSTCIPKIQTATVTVSSSGGSFSVTATQNNLLCNGDSNGTASIVVSGGVSPFTYSWSPSVGSTSAVTGLSAGSYTVLVTDAAGCITPQVVTITQPSVILVTGSSTSTTCTGSNGSATANVSGGSQGYSYLWSNGMSTSTISGLSAGTYSVVVTDANGCMATQTVSVVSAGGFTISTSSTQAGCLVSDGSATANALSGSAPYSYSWSNGQTTQTATGLAAGNYSVTVLDANGCTQTQTVSVSAAPSPIASVSASATTIVPGNSSTLSGSGGGTYQWAPTTGLSCTSCSAPTATPMQTTTYCLIVADSNGCSDTACIVIYLDIPCGALYIPNAFSPNSDLENDLECVLGGCIETMHLFIYDRWGKLMFESTDQKKCWDGTHNGKPLNSAVFTYYLKATLIDGQKVNFKGNISLIR